MSTGGALRDLPADLLYDVGMNDIVTVAASGGTMSEATNVVSEFFRDLTYQAETGLPPLALQYPAADGSYAPEMTASGMPETSDY
jgi:hypothetical protein